MKQVITSASQLGHILASARKAANRTQSAQAAQLGLSQSRLSKMELHTETVTLSQLLALCSSLGLEIIVASRDAASPSNMPW